MAIKGIAIDLDGTLLDDDKKISEYNKKVLKKISDMGIKIVIATGRVYEAMKHYYEELNLDTSIVTYNGACVIDESGRVVFEKNLEEEHTKTLIEIARKKNIHLNLFQDGRWYVEKEREETEMYKMLSGLSYEVKNFDSFGKLSPTKLMFIGEHQKLLKVEDEIDNVLENKVYRAFSKPYFLEVLNSEVSKGKSVIELFEKMGLHKSEIMAFGDGFNDYEMLNLVGHGVVMGNAPIELKQRIGREAKSNIEDGLGKYLEVFFNIKE